MANSRKREISVYILADLLTAMLAWASFFLYRKDLEGETFNWNLLDDVNFYLGVIIIPIGWILFYSIFETYRDIYKLSRLATLTRTFFLSFFGVIFLFFTLILDDFVTDYTTYYTSFLTLLGYHFVFTSIARMIILTWASRRVKKGKVSFNTLIIGGNQNALVLFNEITNRKKRLGYNFMGFIDTNGKSENELEAYLPKLGKIENIAATINEGSIEEVIIAIETSEHNRLKEILDILFDFDDSLLVKIIPDMYDIMLGTVKMNHVFGAVLIEIKRDLMPKWQKMVKRAIDVAGSLFFLILFSPIFIYNMIMVKLSSPGPIFFKQKRIGLNAKPFSIYKFRSMFVNAEQDGPQLSNENDSRCTKWGGIMRKWRLDELPQFFNVIRGDMSLVGPRPEREYYIKKIVERAPHYKHLLKVRPGITSWGQVKYGYASNLEEMLQRLKFDILYIENMSLALDFKILFYTGLVLLQGKGK